MNVDQSQARLDLFWHYVVARRNAELERRVHPADARWTDDPIIQQYRFTNVYRASDRVSQYLIRCVQYDGSQEPEEIIFRTLLFKIFNLPETYKWLTAYLGSEPRIATWDPTRYGTVLATLITNGHKVWNGAYMMTGKAGEAKHDTFLHILDLIVNAGAIDMLAAHANDPSRTYKILHSFPLISDFLAMQFTTDLGYAAYSTWDENAFLVPGHGARRGAYKIAPIDRAETLIEYLTGTQEAAFERAGVSFPWLGGGRRLSRMDIQNCLCEFDKYTRVARPAWKTPLDRSASPKPKQRFDATVPRLSLPVEFYPPKWDIATDAKVYGEDDTR